MFGLLEIHGPIQAVYDESGVITGELNPYTWAKRANMLYIDNPVGAGVTQFTLPIAICLKIDLSFLTLQALALRTRQDFQKHKMMLDVIFTNF